MTAITLTPKEKAIVDRQCSGCMYWNNHGGCYWLQPNDKREPRPIEDCGVFEVKP
ncbi:hypothetical protein LCGC14_1767750 [marine sediment metagenome]|uniref:Uncharacterized protein n=1 Tax=marine sediment metagenome TaxID=412755 RepID=A0A0F9HLN6_9ZZZZ